MVKISPSLLSADFSRMAEGADLVLKHGADWIHCDVMDGNFVPNISFGPKMISDIRRAVGPDAFLDVHLMIRDPERYIDAFAAAGASLICVHAEAAPHLQRTLTAIRDHGIMAGVALNPATSEHALDYIYPDVDMVLCMTVNPGFGGQKLLPAVIEKVKKVNEVRKTHGFSFEIEVDGGVNTENAKSLRDAGATVLVAGNAVFKASDISEAIRLMKG